MTPLYYSYETCGGDGALWSEERVAKKIRGKTLRVAVPALIRPYTYVVDDGYVVEGPVPNETIPGLQGAYVDLFDEVAARAAKESEIPNFKGSDLGRFPLVSADFWTSDHLSERSRSVDAFSGTRARGTLTLKRRCITILLPRYHALAYGATRWFLFPPVSHYPEGGVHAFADRLDAGNWPFPKPLECVQRPGEVLYVPTGWHQAHVNLAESAALNVQLATPTHVPLDRDWSQHGDPESGAAWEFNWKTLQVRTEPEEEEEAADEATEAPAQVPEFKQAE